VLTDAIVAALQAKIVGVLITDRIVLSPTIAFAACVRALGVWRQGRGPVRLPFAPTSLAGWFGANSRFFSPRSIPAAPSRGHAQSAAEADRDDSLERRVVR